MNEVQDDSPTHAIQSAVTRVLEPKVQKPEAAGDAATDAADDDETPSSSAPRRPVARERLGRYVVLGELGHGGMGVVLEAFDRTLDRRVALKVLHRDLDVAHTKRLLREAQALAKLSHPNVVQVYEVGEADEQTFIAMELVKGRSIKAWLSQEPRPGWQECVKVYLQAGEGLAAAHAQGLVHRDFKPSNAVIDDTGRVRVLDFGLARLTEDSRTTRTSYELSVEEPAFEAALTHAGEVMGTPGYMAPEQMRGLEVDARTDQFSYCVALYEALYGERPYVGRSLEALMASMASRQLQPLPPGIDVPAAVRMAVRRGLAVEPHERWPSMTALLVALRKLVEPRPRRRGVVVLGVAGGLVAIGLGLARHAEVGYRCEGANAQLQGVWDGARRREVEAAIAATTLPYARDTWLRVEARLDEYADAWVAAHTEACEATSVRQEQSAEVMELRMACLHARRDALQQAVSVLGQADATRVAHAVELVTSLPGLPACDDVEALRAELPPPEDPEVAMRVKALREELVQAEALRDAGDPGAAASLADAVVAEAEGVPYVPILAEGLLMRGTVREGLGRDADAEADELRAYLLAAEHGHDAVEAKAVTRLVLLVGQRRGDLDAGLRWGTTALALAKGLPAEPTLEASALTSIGVLLHARSELPEALDHFERALAIDERALGSDHPRVARLLRHLGHVLRDQGKLAEALDHQRRALAVLERALGPRHPAVEAEAQAQIQAQVEIEVQQ
jgi:tRNA A-37 threonylcarbamoyl transferase component Bud32/tetratricopeptide (TPR) repeat protein